jgi:hypothetical protein
MNPCARPGGGGEIEIWKNRRTTSALAEQAAAFQQLVEEQRQLLVPNEFDRVYTTAGHRA